jgi:hypothetical protein
MFNKAQLKERYNEVVDELGESPHSILLSAGGALVMMGLRETTRDLDLDVPQNIFTWAKSKCAKGKSLVERELVRWADDVDLHLGDEHRGLVCIEGVWCYSPNEMLVQKRYLVSHPLRHSRKRLQDRVDIQLLEGMLSKTKFTSKVM